MSAAVLTCLINITYVLHYFSKYAIVTELGRPERSGRRGSVSSDSGCIRTGVSGNLSASPQRALGTDQHLWRYIVNKELTLEECLPKSAMTTLGRYPKPRDATVIRHMAKRNGCYAASVGEEDRSSLGKDREKQSFVCPNGRRTGSWCQRQ